MEQMEMDVESDEEAEAENLRLLNVAIESDHRSAFETASQCSQDTGSFAASHKAEDSHLAEHIETALAYNKLISEKVKRLEKVLMNRLFECRGKLSIIRSMEQAKEGAVKQHEKTPFKYITCGKPYFKDPDRFPAPPNQDTILMAQSDMYDMNGHYCIYGWTVSDKRLLEAIVRECSIEIRTSDLLHLLSKYQRELKNTHNKVLRLKIADVQNQLTELSDKSVKELALPLNEINRYDWEVIANKMFSRNQRHSAHECRSMWKLYLHPAINKNGWPKEEHFMLKAIATRHELQDWDAIATELGTERTGYQCFVYYRTTVKNNITGLKWTNEESEYLRRLVDYYREGNHVPWGKISSQMTNRTKLQVYSKYHRLMIRKKGRFDPEEDSVLLSCMEKFGQDFKKVSKYLGRSVEQVKERYKKLSNQVSITWTVEEDKRLMYLLSNQEGGLKNFVEIVQYFPGKTRVNLRTRYLTLVNFLKRYPGEDLTKAPRRFARKLRPTIKKEELGDALDKLKEKMVEQTKNAPRPRTLPMENTLERGIVKMIEWKDSNEVQEIKVFDKKNHLGLNIKRLLLLFRFKLKKREFEDSDFAIEYPEILSDKLRTSQKVYSYSRKTSAVHLETPTASIWCNDNCPTLGTVNYYLPLNYSTITGFRKLLEYSVNRYSIHSTNKRTNPIFNAQYNLFQQTFKMIFMWAIHLSNRQPNLKKLFTITPKNEQTVRNREILQCSEYYPGSIAIPDINNLRRYNTKNCNQVSISIDEVMNTNNDGFDISDPFEDKLKFSID